MNVDFSTCASFGKAAQWDQHNWPHGELPSQEAASPYRKGSAKPS
jgi:hypothetical protein